MRACGILPALRRATGDLAALRGELADLLGELAALVAGRRLGGEAGDHVGDWRLPSVGGVSDVKHIPNDPRGRAFTMNVDVKF